MQTFSRQYILYNIVIIDVIKKTKLSNRNHVHSYNADVQKIVDESVDKLDTNAWSQLKNKTSARDSAVLASEKAAQAARATIGNAI